MDEQDRNSSPQPPPQPSNGRHSGPEFDRLSRPRRALVPLSRMGATTTEDEQLLNREVPPDLAAKLPELAAFTHTDPWRVLRIQGEFVHGFNALAEVGAGVAVFGSARVGPEHRWYVAARSLGRHLAEAGFAVITGGGPGIMEAANLGAAEVGGL